MTRLEESLNSVRDATLRSATASGQVAEELQRLRGLLAGSPNLLERLAAGRWRNALLALMVVVTLSALVASSVTLAWMEGQRGEGH